MYMYTAALLMVCVCVKLHISFKFQPSFVYALLLFLKGFIFDSDLVNLSILQRIKDDRGALTLMMFLNKKKIFQL